MVSSLDPRLRVSSILPQEPCTLCAFDRYRQRSHSTLLGRKSSQFTWCPASGGQRREGRLVNHLAQSKVGDEEVRILGLCAEEQILGLEV